MTHPLVTELTGDDAAGRRRACAALVADPAAALLLEPLAERLGDPDAGVRRAAGEALAELARRERDARRLLEEALRSGDRRVRFAGARALAELEPPGPRTLSALIAGLQSAEADERWEASRLLVTAGRVHGEVLPLVLGLVRAGSDTATRTMAIHCLRELGPDHPDAGAALLEASRDADAGIRRAALTALPALLDEPEAVAERLREAAEGDPDPGARGLAEQALRLTHRAGVEPRKVP